MEASFALVETDWPDGFAADDHAAALRPFLASARAVAAGRPPLRTASAPCGAFAALCRAAATAPEPAPGADARRFFEAAFRPYRIVPQGTGVGDASAFFTGYYEPVVPGALERKPGFLAPILARPERTDGPLPTRCEIEAGVETGQFRPVVWLRDWVEAFFVQVQGSARVTLEDGRRFRLVYDGRNGHPYTSIGRHLVEAGRLTPANASMDGIKAWVRAHGQESGDAGREVLQRNESFVFFRAEHAPDDEGPIGGAGLPLTALRSIAIDRAIWPYGLPFWIEADLPGPSARVTPLRRLMVAQDTGSAIVGPARADLFFGSGEKAGLRAGAIRHAGRMAVLLPRAREPAG